MPSATAKRGRPKSQSAKDAKTRKAEFDRRMRNVGGQAVPGEPERFPCVIYLCKEAKLELQRNRAVAGVTGSPLSDSKLVEALLLSGAASVLTSSSDELPTKYRLLAAGDDQYWPRLAALARELADTKIQLQSAKASEAYALKILAIFEPDLE